MPSMSPLMAAWYCWIGLFAVWMIAAPFARRTRSAETFLQRLRHSIPLGLGYFLIISRHRDFFVYGRLYDTGWANWIVYPGLLMTVSGCLFAVWARIHLGRYWSGNITLKEGHKIITTGPYRFVRHPIYTGWIAAAFGTALTCGTGDAFCGVALVVVSFYIKLRREEKLLTAELGDEYRAVPAERSRGPVAVPLLGAVRCFTVRGSGFTVERLRACRVRS